MFADSTNLQHNKEIQELYYRTLTISIVILLLHTRYHQVPKFGGGAGGSAQGTLNLLW